MLQLELEPELTQTDRLVWVQEEPALELALPQVFVQPPLETLQRGKLPQVEGLVARLYRTHLERLNGGLGRDYQELVTEFQPLFQWGMACWDYLLTTEGCRFLPRQGHQKTYSRGDYRVLTDGDFSRLLHGVFRECVFAFAQQPEIPSLSQWLRERFWPAATAAYQRLSQPADPRQRPLTAYSYLRCSPYRFLNRVHQELMDGVLAELPTPQRRALEYYFLHFYTEVATTHAVDRPLEESLVLLRQGLTALLLQHRLAYCLLRQIERY